MNKNNFKIPIEFEKINDIYLNDGRFTRVKIWLMHLGANYNGSYFSKEAVDKAIPTLAYIPIVGFIENNKFGEKDFSDHRIVTIETEEGKKDYFKLLEEEIALSKRVGDNTKALEEEYLILTGVSYDATRSNELLNKSLFAGLKVFNSSEIFINN